MFSKFLSGGRGTPSKEPENGKKSTDEEASPPDSTEGFLCPNCMHAFPSAELLQDHYETSHLEGAGAVVCPACKMTLGSHIELESHFARHHKPPSSQTKSGDINKLKQELTDVNASLKEERWYSEELKKEISKLQGEISKCGGSPDDTEVELLKTQNKALEEGKTLMVSEINFLRKQLEDSTTLSDKIHGERDRLEEKAAKLNMELASLKANHDELNSSKSSLEKELGAKQALITKLETEIRQRPAADDVVVLRQELVSVQKMMDSLSLEKDKTIESLQNFTQELRDKCRLLEERNGELHTALSSAPSQDQIKSLEVQGSQALHEQMAKNSQLQLKVESLENQLGHLQDQVASERSSRQKESTQHSSQLSAEQQHVQQLLAQLKQKEGSYEQQRLELEERLAAEKQRSSQTMSDHAVAVSKLSHQVEQLQHGLEEKEARSKELTQQLAALQANLEAENSKCDQLRSQSRTSEMSLQELSRQMEQRESQLQQALSDVHKLKETIQRQDEEKAALYEKIQHGEGTSTALEQLKAENAILLQKLKQLKEAHNHAGEENLRQVEALHLQLKELKSQLGDVTDSYEKSKLRVAELTNQHRDSTQSCASLEKELETKMKEYSAAELGWASQQAELDRSIHSLTASLDLKNSQLEASSNTVNTLKGELRELVDQGQHYQDQVGELTQTIVALEDSLSAKTEEMLTCQADHAKLKKELEAKSQSMASLDAQLLKKSYDHNQVCQQLENEKNSLKKQISDLMASQSSLEHQLGTLNKELESYGELQIHASQLAKQVEEMSREGEATTALCQQKETQLVALQTESKDLQENLATLQEESLLTLQRTQALHQEEVQKKEEECHQLHTEMERLTKQLEETNINQKQLAENLEHTGQMNANLSQKLMESEEELVRLQSNNKLLSSQKAKLGEQASQLRSSHKELELRASELEKELEAMRASCQKEQQSYRSEIADLKETKKLLISQKHILQNSLEKVKQRLEQLVAKSNDHVLLLQGQCNSLQKEIEGQQRLLNRTLHQDLKELIALARPMGYSESSNKPILVSQHYTETDASSNNFSFRRRSSIRHYNLA